MTRRCLATWWGCWWRGWLCVDGWWTIRRGSGHDSSDNQTHAADGWWQLCVLGQDNWISSDSVQQRSPLRLQSVFLSCLHQRLSQSHYGWTENAGVENEGWSKIGGWKADEWKTLEENAGVEITRMESVGGDCSTNLFSLFQTVCPIIQPMQKL